MNLGRIYEQGDARFAQEAFSTLVNRTSANNHGKGSLMIQIGNTEVGYASSSKEEVASKITPIIRVKGALAGLQHAIQGKMEPSCLRECWLGVTCNAYYWTYVYLTEPDTILQTRPLALVQIREALDNGLILAHHFISNCCLTNLT
jgi:hypothetical protein